MAERKIVKVTDREHPWFGSTAELVGVTPGVGMKARIIADDALDGHEFYLFSGSQCAHIQQHEIIGGELLGGSQRF